MWACGSLVLEWDWGTQLVFLETYFERNISHVTQGPLVEFQSWALAIFSNVFFLGLYLLSQYCKNKTENKHSDFVHFRFHIQESLQSTCTSRCCIEIAGRVYSIQTEQSGPLFYL